MQNSKKQKALYENYIRIDTYIPHNLLCTGRCEFTIKHQICENLCSKQRKYTVFIEDKWVENQQTPGDESKFISCNISPGKDGLQFEYKYKISKISLGIEVFNEEKQIIAKEYPHIDKIVSEIFQSIMVDFSRYYNESLNGLDYIEISANSYGPMIFTTHYDNNTVNNLTTITGTFTLPQNYVGQTFKIDEIEQLSWRHYINKARHKYNLCEYLDCILWCAISVESYVISLISDNNLTKEIDDYKKDNDNNISLFAEVDILRKNSVIEKSEAKKIKKTFSLIKDSRNSIVHGDVGPTSFNKELAKQALESTLPLFQNTKYINKKLHYS